MAAILNCKLLCSLHWISSLLKATPNDKWSQIIDEALLKKELSAVLITSLTTPLVYCTVYSYITNDYINTASFWPLIQSLAQHGLYLEDPRSNNCISNTVLVSNDPFIEVVHIVLIQGLMSVYTSIVSPVTNIIRSIKQVSSLTASKELPTTIEEGLYLWVNKVSLLHDKSRYGCVLPSTVTFDSLIDGRSIAATLLYYCKDDRLSWRDFKFSGKLLSTHDSLHNIKTIKSFCDTSLPLPSCHIEPQLWINEYQSLRDHVLTFLSFLYHSLVVSHTTTVPTNNNKLSSKPPDTKHTLCTVSSSSSSLLDVPVDLSCNIEQLTDTNQPTTLNGKEQLATPTTTTSATPTLHDTTPIYLHITDNDQTTEHSHCSNGSSVHESLFKEQVQHLKSIINNSTCTSTSGQRKEEERKGVRHEQMKHKIELRDKERKKLIIEKRKMSHENDTYTPSPPSKTNSKLIRNAICYVCLAGDANISLKQRVLSELDNSEHVCHFMLLFRDNIGLKFKGLYGYSTEHEYSKLYGVGPKIITAEMIEKLYKYNCGTKSFQCVPSLRSFSPSVDGFTIQNCHWTPKTNNNNTSKRRSSLIKL